MFKNRKLISMLLTVSMLLTLFPFAAFAGETEVGQEQAAPVEAQKVAEINGTQYGTLSDAINAVQDGETIKLLDAVSETNVVSVDNGKTFTIDLNGKTLSLGARMSIKSAFVTVQNGTIKGDIALTASGKDAAYNSFTLASNAAIEGDYGIMVFEDEKGANNFGTTVNIDGKITGKSSALWVLGNITTDWATAKHPVTVNVGPTAVLTNPSKDATALQMAGSCVVTIEDGAQITGGTAIEVRAGKLTVNGGTITGTGDSTTSDPNGNGISTKGAGIAVAQHTTKQPIDVVVNGGTITGHTGFYVANPQKNAEVSEVNATINGGDFVTTAPDGNAVVRDENAGGADVAVTGGSFTGKVDQSLLGEGFEAVPDANGKLTVAVSANAEATWYQNGVKKAGALDAAIKALQGQGGTIEVLKDAKITDANYTLTGNIVLQKSASAAAAPKIDVTVAAGEKTRAFIVMPGAGLTLDGVEMTVNGTKNADSEKNNDGTGIDLYNSEKAEIGGAILTLKNGAVLNLTNLERATIASCSGKVVNDSIVRLEPGTAFNISNIDGNGANGGNWTIDNATLDMDNIGSFGLSAQSVTVTNKGKVNVSNVGIAGMSAKDIAIEKGSQVSITESGYKLPYVGWKGAETKDVMALKDDGSFVLDKKSKLELTDNIGKDNKDVNTFGPGNGTVKMSGEFIGEVNVPEPAKNEVRITYTVDGDVYSSFIVKKDADAATISFKEPAKPSVSGYTFNGWKYGKSNVKVKNGVVTLTLTKNVNTYTFSADLSKNTIQEPEYQVNVAATNNGTVTVSPKKAEYGERVTITVKPNKGYVVDEVVVTDKDGDEVTVTKKADDKYTFTMPKSKVKVKVTFKAENAEPAKPEQPSGMPFVDVVKGAWYYPAVEYVYNNNLMNGTNGGMTFEPNVDLNRAMMAAVLYNMEGQPACNKRGLFSDVADGRWYTNAINWAASNNIVSGMPDGSYAPNQALTREQMASILYRYAEYKGIDVNTRVDLSKFTDGATTSSWAQGVVQWAVAEKLINGNGNELQPKGTASRAQVATVLMNFCENVAK